MPVPEPTRSVVVFPGHRAAAARETKRPVDALRLTERAMVAPPSGVTPRKRALASVRRPTTPATIEAQHPVGLRVDLGVTGRACANRFAPFEVRLPGALNELYMPLSRKLDAGSGRFLRRSGLRVPAKGLGLCKHLLRAPLGRQHTRRRHLSGAQRRALDSLLETFLTHADHLPAANCVFACSTRCRFSRPSICATACSVDPSCRAISL